MNTSEKDKRQTNKRFSKCLDKIIEFILPKYLPLIMFIGILILKALSYRNPTLNTFLNNVQYIVSNKILTDNLLSSLIEIPVVLLGIYITVISVFGIGFSKATILVSKNNLANKFMKYAEVAIFTTVIFLISTIFYDVIYLKLWGLIYLDLMLWCLANFLRFIVITMRMYHINITDACSNSNKTEELTIELLEEISLMLKSEKEKINDYNDDEYFEQINKINEDKVDK